MKTRILILLLSLVLAASCGSDDSDDTSATDEAATLYAAVDDLNVRASADPELDAFYRLAEGEPVAYLGEGTKQVYTYTLRGKEYTTNFIKVELTNGETGWVFAAALSPEKGDYLQSPSGFQHPDYPTPEDAQYFDDYLSNQIGILSKSESTTTNEAEDHLFFIYETEYVYSNGVTLTRVVRERNISSGETTISFPGLTVAEVFTLMRLIEHDAATPFESFPESDDLEFSMDNQIHHENKLDVEWKDGEPLSFFLEAFYFRTTLEYNDEGVPTLTDEWWS